MNNDVIGNLGVPEPKDPFAILGTPDESRQSAVRDRLAQAAEVRSINYETLPLYVESFLLAVICDQFRQDNIFPYDGDDELKTKIIISSTWQRGTTQSRDLRPRVVVGFQNASSENTVLRDSFLRGLASDPIQRDTRGQMETMSFRIAVMHHNRSLVLFLAGTIRGLIAATSDTLRETFNLQRVAPPTLSGPGSIEELEDVYGAFIDLEILAVPRWEIRKNPEYIRRIIIETIGNAMNTMSGAIVQEQTIVSTQAPRG